MTIKFAASVKILPINRTATVTDLNKNIGVKV